MKNLIRILILASAVILTTSLPSAGWLIYHKPEFRGKVIDAETKEPIEGAVVVVTYYKTTYYIIDSSTDVIEAKETLTDKNGEFCFSSYTALIQPFSGEDYATFIIYKPGYGRPIYSPYGITPVYEQIFFSKGIGVTGELDLGPNFKMVNITCGIVELPKLNAREERLKAIPSWPIEEPASKRAKKLPLLYKTIIEEDKRLGLSGE